MDYPPKLGRRHILIPSHFIKKEENEMRTEISRIWLENEAVAERKMANELGYCVEVYRRRVAEEEDIESNLYNGEVI